MDGGTQIQQMTPSGGLMASVAEGDVPRVTPVWHRQGPPVGDRDRWDSRSLPTRFPPGFATATAANR